MKVKTNAAQVFNSRKSQKYLRNHKDSWKFFKSAKQSWKVPRIYQNNHKKKKLDFLTTEKKNLENFQEMWRILKFSKHHQLLSFFFIDP